MMVLGEPCEGLKQFTCPYHAWNYGLDGNLIRAPFFDGTPSGIENGILDPTAFGLVPVRCAVWHHWVFVDFSGTAQPIEEHLQPLLDFMNDADIGAMRYAGMVEWEFQANWKMVGDNWENYHHVYVHGGVFAKMTDDIDMETGELWSAPLHKGSVLTLRRRIEVAPSYTFKDTGLPLIPFPEGRERVTAPNYIFPNIEIDLVRDNLSSIIYEPVAPGRTIAKMGFFFVGDAQHRMSRPKAAVRRWTAGLARNVRRKPTTGCATRTSVSGRPCRSPKAPPPRMPMCSRRCGKGIRITSTITYWIIWKRKDVGVQKNEPGRTASRAQRLLGIYSN